MGKTALILMIFTFISKITGLIREKFFAYYLGTSDLLDIYNTSSSIPIILFSFIFTSLVTVFIPIYQEIQVNNSRRKADLFTSNLVNILFIISIFCIAFIYFFAPTLVGIFAPAYTGQKLQTTIEFTRIMSLTIITSVFAPIFIAYLRIYNRFITAEFPGILMNFLYIISLILTFYFKNIYLLPILFVATEILKYFFFPITIRKTGYKHRWILNFKDKKFLELLKISIPIIISIAAIDISTISDQSNATLVMETGGISIMRFASLVLTLINGVIVVSITTTIYPTISKYANQYNIKKVKNTLLDGNIYSFLLIIPSIIGVSILSEPIIRLLFQGGNFNAESTKITASVLIYYIPALLGQTIIQMINRGYYSLKNTFTPIIITLVQVILNIILNKILSQYMGLQGLALATTISSFVAAFVAIILFSKKYGNIGNKILIISMIKILIASSIMGVATYYSYHSLFNLNYVLALTISLLISIFVYTISIIFIRIPHLIKILNLVYKKFNRKKIGKK